MKRTSPETAGFFGTSGRYFTITSTLASGLSMRSATLTGRQIGVTAEVELEGATNNGLAQRR